MKITQNEKVTEYINNTSSEQKELFEILRQLIHKTISGTTEELKWGMPVFIKTKIFSKKSINKHYFSSFVADFSQKSLDLSIFLLNFV